MRRLIVIALLALGGCQQPDFYDTEGNGYRYEDFSGKWRIVNYWATWCGPCIKEIPELNTLAAEHADQLVVLGVNYDAPEPGEMERQVRRMKIEFPVYATEPAAALGITRPEVLPTTFIFTPDGQLYQTLVGPQTEDSLLAALEES